MAGFILETAARANIASAHTHSARTVVPVVETARMGCATSMTNDSMTNDSVPLPPPTLSAPQNGDVRRLVAAVPFVTVSWLLMVAVVVMAMMRISRWELAPGEAMAVSPRISFEARAGSVATVPERHRAENSIRFVTAFGGQLTALDSVLGWLDPHVQVDTYEEHFGTRTPTSSRQVGFQAMYTAKQVAEYVAMKRLGLDATFTEGRVTVNELVCSEDPRPKSACKVLEVGDTLVSFDGADVPTLSSLAAAMKGRDVGEEVILTVAPHGTSVDDKKSWQERTVELMANPDDAARTIIGFVPADTRTVTLPFEVNISTTDIGGPSAGLAFTLALLDDLSPGNLTGRGRVVATGTMAEDGTVGAIGALRQKAVAARDAGATLFLVPTGQSADEVRDARAAGGVGLKIVQVGSLDEALVALRSNGGDPLPAG